MGKIPGFIRRYSFMNYYIGLKKLPSPTSFHSFKNPQITVLDYLLSSGWNS
jgi:hypothetical protein